MTRLGWLVLLVGLAHGALYAALLPPWGIMDEQQHYDHARRLAGGHGPPVVARTRLLPEVSQNVFDSQRWQKFGWPVPDSADPADWGLGGYSYEAHQPPLYYALMSVVLKLLPDDVSDQLFASRFIGVALSGVTLAALALTILCIWPERRDLALLACMLLVLMTERTESISRMNNDGLAEALGALVIWLSTRCAVHGVTLSRSLLLAGVFALALLTKMTCLALGLPIAAAFWLHRRSPGVLGAAAAAVLVVVVLTVPIFLYTWSRTDFFAMQSTWLEMRNYEPQSLDPRGFARSLLTLFQGYWFFQEFWNVWRYGGAARSALTTFAFAGAVLVVGLAMLRWVRAWGRAFGRRATAEVDLPTFWSAVLAATVVGCVGIVFVLLDRGSIPLLQGRYLLPYGVAVLVLVVGGHGGERQRVWIVALAAILALVDALWLVDGQLLRFYARSPYALDTLAQLGVSPGPAGWVRVAMSDKPSWVSPLAIVAALTYAGSLAALVWALASSQLRRARASG